MNNFDRRRGTLHSRFIHQEHRPTKQPSLRRFSLEKRSVGILLAILLLLVVSVASAQDVARLRITHVDIDAFPQISVRYIAQEAANGPVVDASTLVLSENGEPVADFATERITVGLDLIFVINANDTININDSTPTTRREKVKDAINLYADNYMSEMQLDRLSIVVPIDDDVPDGILLNDAIFVNEVKNAINFYEPAGSPDVQINDMLQRALAIAAEGAAEGRFQAVVLFTDGATQESELAQEVIDQAVAQEVTFYSVILGARADDVEIANVSQLIDPTFGSYIHMPETADSDPFFALISGFGVQTEVTYRSKLTTSADHTVGLTLGTGSATADFSLLIANPSVKILLDDSLPIKRVAQSADSPLAELMPDSQKVVAQVTWPAGAAERMISSASLEVNGEVVTTVDQIALDNDGVMEMAWDISANDAGSYSLVVSVVDELGLAVSSDPLLLNIEVQRPELVVVESETEAETVDEVAPEPTTVADIADVEEVLRENANVIGIAGAVGAVLLAIILLVIFFAVLRRRSKRNNEPVIAPVAPAVAPAVPSPFDAESTQIMAPAFVQRKADAFLEALENAPEHSGPIYVTGNNVALGRDAKLAQIVFKDKSVSRLHARIMESGGQFRLYDEGSASGTYHNYDRVGLTPQTLSDNDDIHIGRVHLRFKTSSGGGQQAAAAPLADNDATQVFGPTGPSQPAPPPPVDDNLSTQPYIPHGPSSPQAPSQPNHEEDQDDLSTKPYIPHSPDN